MTRLFNSQFNFKKILDDKTQSFKNVNPNLSLGWRRIVEPPSKRSVHELNLKGISRWHTVIDWYTRWFKYDRDKLWLVYTQKVPVIFEPPCILNNTDGFEFKKSQLPGHSICLYLQVEERENKKLQWWALSTGAQMVSKKLWFSQSKIAVTPKILRKFCPNFFLS